MYVVVFRFELVAQKSTWTCSSTFCSLTTMCTNSMWITHILHYFLDILLTIRSNTSRVGQQEFGEGLDIAFGRIITDAWWCPLLHSALKSEQVRLWKALNRHNATTHRTWVITECGNKEEFPPLNNGSSSEVRTNFWILKKPCFFKKKKIIHSISNI